MTRYSTVKRLLLCLHQVYAQLLLINNQTIVIAQVIPVVRRNIEKIQEKIQPLRTLKDRNITMMRVKQV